LRFILRREEFMEAVSLSGREPFRTNSAGTYEGRQGRKKIISNQKNPSKTDLLIILQKYL